MGAAILMFLLFEISVSHSTAHLSQVIALVYLTIWVVSGFSCTRLIRNLNFIQVELIFFLIYVKGTMCVWIMSFRS